MNDVGPQQVPDKESETHNSVEEAKRPAAPVAWTDLKNIVSVLDSGGVQGQPVRMDSQAAQAMDTASDLRRDVEREMKDSHR